jgi:hypothetical protein
VWTTEEWIKSGDINDWEELAPEVYNSKTRILQEPVNDIQKWLWGSSSTSIQMWRTDQKGFNFLQDFLQTGELGLQESEDSVSDELPSLDGALTCFE